MADYDWFDDRGPTEAEQRASKYRPLGLIARFERMSSTRIKYFECHRGCGTLVWNPEEHMKNVCRDWSPVAG